MSLSPSSAGPHLSTVPLAPLTGRERWPRLPASLASLIGREREVATVGTLLGNPAVRLVTLTGPGGVGKTGLALAAAREADRSGASVAFVGLASITDPDLVATTIVQTLGLQHTGQRPADQVLIGWLRDAHLLLVLDNFEQVLPAAPLVAALLSACPALTILVTSRLRLQLSGERVIPVAPLTVPRESGTFPEISSAAAVRLFVERAHSVDPAFVLTETNAVLVADICRRLDGLPLAIELAAPRVRHLPLPILRDRLERRLSLLTGGARDQPNRLQTMRNAIAWSHDLLQPDEQALIHRLSVFAGGFTLDAAEAVGGVGLRPQGVPPAAQGVPLRSGGEGGTGGDGGASARAPSPPEGISPTPPEQSGTPSVFEGLAALIDASLLEQEARSDGTARYRMLETIREFAGEQLAAGGSEAAVRDRHAAWCLGLAEAARAGYYTAEEPAWMNRLADERDNLRAALGWFAADRRAGAEAGLRLAAALAWFWHSRGPAREGDAWLERLLGHRAGVAPAVRADALTGAALLAWTVGEFDRAAARLDEALALWRGLGDRPGLVRALNFMALVTIAQGDIAGERAANEEAVAVAREVGDPVWLALSLGSLGHTLARQGETARAVEVLNEDLGLLRSVGYERGMGWAQEGLGMSMLASGDAAQAQAHFREAIALAWKDRSLVTVAIELPKLAAAFAAGGQPERATRLLGAAAGLWTSLGATTAIEAVYDGAKEADLARAALGEERFAAAWQEGQAQPLEQTIGEALEPTTAPVAPPPFSLTRRETEILRHLAAGRTDPAIAETLSISVRTVENHVAHIFAKLNVRTRTAAASVAFAAGLVTPGSPTNT